MSQGLGSAAPPRNAGAAVVGAGDHIGAATAGVRERTRRPSGDQAAARLEPDRLAEAYWQLRQRPRDGWTNELDLRPYRKPW